MKITSGNPTQNNVTDSRAPHIVVALAALAQETRLHLYRLLVQAGPAGQVVNQLIEAMQIPSATLSFHLKSLTHANLIVPHSEGRFIRYRADFTAMHGLIDFLSENCCGSERSRCAPAGNDASETATSSCSKGHCV